MMRSYRAFMCKIDFEDERGDPCEGNSFFSEIESLRNAHSCADECGIVEVEISLIRVVTEGSDD